MQKQPPQASKNHPEGLPSSVPIPPVEVLQEARELLLDRLGPCAASRSELVLATAREMMTQLDSPPSASAVS